MSEIGTFSIFVPGCNRIYNESHGEITSPGYPNNYDNYLDCTYIITVQENYYIILTFMFLDIEKYHGTCADYLQVSLKLSVSIYLQKQLRRKWQHVIPKWFDQII